MTAQATAAATMTDRRPDGTSGAARRAAPSQRSAAFAWGGSAIAFAVVLVLLAWQVASGADPAIGDGPQTATQPAAERVLVRRIVRRVVVTHEAPAAAPAPAGSGGGTVVSAPAPAAAAAPPAPAAPAAPAPAPAVPAPPTTRSS
jgi:hypothetical protein